MVVNISSRTKIVDCKNPCTFRDTLQNISNQQAVVMNASNHPKQLRSQTKNPNKLKLILPNSRRSVPGGAELLLDGSVRGRGGVRGLPDRHLCRALHSLTVY